MLRRLLPFLSVVVIVGGLFAQPPGQPAPQWGNLPYITQVTQAAQQLFYHVERLRVFASTFRHPQAGQLQQLVNNYYEDVLAFTRFVQRNPVRPQVEVEYRKLDRKSDAIVQALRTFPNTIQNSQLLQLASRIEFADQQLGAAVLGGGPNPPPAGNLVRLSRSLDTQAEDLLRIARDTLKNDPFSQQLERDIRNFTRTVDQFRRTAEATNNPDQLQRSFQGVQSSWNTVTQSLLSRNTLWDSLALRQSVTQVANLVTTLGRLLGGGINPGPLPPAPWPPVDPGRRRVSYAVGADAGGGPHVRLFRSARTGESDDLFAYDPDFRGGVRVAVGDADGDSIQDVITAPGPGMPPLIRVFSGRDQSLIREFLAFDGNYRHGVFVATADFNRNRRTDVVCGSERGTPPLVRVFDAVTGQRLAEFTAYEPSFRGGVRVAVGDINGDGTPDVITAPGPGRPARIRVFDGRNVQNVLAEFDAYDPAFRGGAFVAAADFSRDGRKEIFVGPDAGGGSHCKLVNGMTGQVVFDFFPVDPAFAGGIRVACRDVNGDGAPDFVCATGPGVPTVVRIFSGRGGQPINEFQPFDPWWANGAFVGCR